MEICFSQSDCNFAVGAWASSGHNVASPVHGGIVDVGAAEEPGIAEPTVDAARVGVVVAGVTFGAPGDEIGGGGGGTSRGAGAADFMPSRCWRPFPPLPGRRRPD